MRRSSRSVCANLGEAWRKRRYLKSFISKLSDAEGEAAETQTWIEFAVRCGYLDRAQGAALYQTYDHVIAMLIRMIDRPEAWVIPMKTSSIHEDWAAYTADDLPHDEE